MIVIKPSISFGWIYSFAQIKLLLLTSGVVGFFFLSDLHHNHDLPMMIEGKPEKEMKFDNLFMGPLSLKEDTRSILALSLEQKLVLLAQSVRPDFGVESRSYRIGVDGSTEQRVVKEGEAIYCDLEIHPSGGAESVKFSDSVAEVKLIPHVLDNRSLKLAVEKTGEEAFDILLRVGSQYREGKDLPETMRGLKEAKWWGQDCLFSTYGGTTFSQMGRKQKLEVGSQLLYVRAGDFLSLEEEGWKVLSSIEQARHDTPLGLVHTITGDQIEVEVWDDKGFSLFEAHIQKQPASPIRTNPTQLITEAKRRTAQRVSCKIGNKRWILKPGDWLLGTESGWRRLQTEEEMGSYLNQEILGELIVIDSVNPSGLLSGHILDKRRTVIQPFSIQIAGTPAKKRRTRR